MSAGEVEADCPSVSDVIDSGDDDGILRRAFFGRGLLIASLPFAGAFFFLAVPACFRPPFRPA